MITTLLVVAAFAVIAFYLIAVFNRLVSLRARFKNAFAQIEVHLVRRLDLIPNLVNTAKAYLQHERETLEAVTQARQNASEALKQFSANPNDANAANKLAAAESHLNRAMGGFNLSMEAYPDLKGSANMMQLSEELITTENQVSFARQAYNDAVMSYNEYKQSFPAVLLAKMLGHGPDAVLLTFDDRPNLHVAPTVQF